MLHLQVWRFWGDSYSSRKISWGIFWVRCGHSRDECLNLLSASNITVFFSSLQDVNFHHCIDILSRMDDTKFYVDGLPWLKYIWECLYRKISILSMFSLFQVAVKVECEGSIVAWDFRLTSGKVSNQGSRLLISKGQAWYGLQASVSSVAQQHDFLMML